MVLASAAEAGITISSGQTQNMSCSGGTCVPTGAAAVLNVGDLETMLASGSVEVTTTGSGVQADNIDINAALTWSNTSTLVLNAYDSIDVSKPVSVAGAGLLTLTTNDGGSNGTLSFGPKGHVTFQNLAGALSINGTAYTLENSVKTLARAVLANPNGAFALANDYDATGDGTYESCPMNAVLTGTIEGLGNTISNLSIDANPRDGKHHYAAFVGGVGSGGLVENLRLKAILYMGAAIGGLAAENSGHLLGDDVDGSLTSRGDSAGGLVEANYGTIISSSANVRVKVGCCKYAEGLAGGLVGDNQGTIELSRAGGDVSGPLGVGGLADSNEGTISESFATGNVIYGGGLVGINQDNGAISNSYATGAARGNISAGFIQEEASGLISSSYSTGLESGSNGGFVCETYADGFSDDYWDTTTSGTDDGACDGNVSGVTGLTTQQLQSGLPSGFDPNIWAENPKINKGLPYLINNPPEKK